MISILSVIQVAPSFMLYVAPSVTVQSEPFVLNGRMLSGVLYIGAMLSAMDLSGHCESGLSLLTEMEGEPR